MKKLLFALALLLTVTAVEAKRNPMKQFFADCKKEYNMKQLKIGRFVFWLMSKFADLEEDEKAVVSSIRQIRILHLGDEDDNENENKIKISKKDKEKFVKKLHETMKKLKWERQLEVRDNEGEVYWLADKKNGHILIAGVEDDDEMGVVYIKVKGDTWQQIISSEFVNKISKDK
jgi:pyruvoyl-dependent arginine decarboxylase (PvlArgDC)